MSLTTSNIETKANARRVAGDGHFVCAAAVRNLRAGPENPLRSCYSDLMGAPSITLSPGGGFLLEPTGSVTIFTPEMLSD